MEMKRARETEAMRIATVQLTNRAEAVTLGRNIMVRNEEHLFSAFPS